jgi:hypothetical protein
MQELEKNGDLTASRQQVHIFSTKDNLQIHFFKEEVEGTQWGKTGPGGAYWRDSAITGQGFFDKMVKRAQKRLNCIIVLGMEHVSRSKAATI